MSAAYERLIRENLRQIYGRPMHDLEARLGAQRSDHLFFFKAFGEPCCIGPDGITLSGITEHGPKGLILSLYALHSGLEPLQEEPFKAFRDLPGSMPYQGAFSANSERVLIPHVSAIRREAKRIAEAFDGGKESPSLGGDFSLRLRPLPKVALAYIFYEGDEEFPPSATCLLSANALSFIPLDALADVAEHTSREIIRRIAK
jgi:hypothetical protein